MKRVPFHPFLLAALPILFLFVQNHGQVLPSELLVPLLVVLVAVLVAFAAVLLVARDTHLAAAVTSLALLMILWYGPIRAAQESLIGAALRHRHTLLLMALVLAAVVFLLRDRARARAVTAPANTFAVILAAMVALQLGASEWSRMQTVQDVGDSFAGVWNRQDAAPADSVMRRSIYYIILDAYARQDVLRDMYAFDNTPFTEALQSRGFQINPESRSNYTQTFLSLSSSLNGIHLTPLAALEGSGTRSTDRIIPFRLIRDGRVMRFLGERGYTTINIASGWGPTDIMPAVDITARCGPSEFTEMLLRQTAAWPLVVTRVKEDIHQLRLCQLRRLAQTPELSGPKFVLAHLILPHPPYVFGPNGERVPGELTALGDEAPWQRKDLYVDQLRFANQAILPVLDTIIAHEEPAPIIILQSDHGPASSSPGPWRPSNRELVRERMSILNAMFLPTLDSATVREFVTPVTTFPRLMREYFGVDWSSPPDVSYFSTSEQPFNFIRVDSLLVRTDQSAPLP